MRGVREVDGPAAPGKELSGETVEVYVSRAYLTIPPLADTLAALRIRGLALPLPFHLELVPAIGPCSSHRDRT